MKYYGNLEDTPSASGSASVTVPGGLAATDTLLLFAEQVYGPNYIDFAGPSVQLTWAAPTGLGKVDETVTLNDGIITGTTTDMEYSTDGTTWTTCSATQTTGLAPGTYQVRYSGTVVNGIQAVLASPVANVTIAPYTAVAPVITSGDSFTCMAGTGGSFPLTATGTAPITFVLGGTWPAGVTVSGNNLVMANTVAAGTHSFTITATNAAGSSAPQSFTLTVNVRPAPGPIPKTGDDFPFAELTALMVVFAAGGVWLLTKSGKGRKKAQTEKQRKTHEHALRAKACGALCLQGKISISRRFGAILQENRAWIGYILYSGLPTKGDQHDDS